MDEETVKERIFHGDTKGVLNFFLVRSRDSKQQNLGYGFVFTHVDEDVTNLNRLCHSYGIFASFDVTVRARAACKPNNTRCELVPSLPEASINC